MKLHTAFSVLFFIFFFFTLLSAFAHHSQGQHQTIHRINQNTDVVANDDLISIYENTSWETPVLNNDYGLADGIGSLIVTIHPKHGKLEISESNTIWYTPNSSFVGFDEFEYQVCNKNKTSCDKATVFIEVLDVDYQPITLNDTIRVYDETDLAVNLLKNDANLFDIPINITVLTDLKNGYSEIRPDNTLKPHFENYFAGMDSLQYEVCDVEGDCSRAWAFFIMSKDQQGGIKIPSGFSPNGDQWNETFFIPELQHYTDIELKILDRNGMLVYKARPYDNNWNGFGNQGSYSGQLVPSGTYYYLIKLKGYHKEITGFIYIQSKQ